MQVFGARPSSSPAVSVEAAYCASQTGSFISRGYRLTSPYLCITVAIGPYSLLSLRAILRVQQICMFLFIHMITIIYSLENVSLDPIFILK